MAYVRLRALNANAKKKDGSDEHINQKAGILFVEKVLVWMMEEKKMTDTKHAEEVQRCCVLPFGLLTSYCPLTSIQTSITNVSQRLALE